MDPTHCRVVAPMVQSPPIVSPFAKYPAMILDPTCSTMSMTMTNGMQD